MSRLMGRVDQLGERSDAGHTARMVQELADEYGLHPEEVRREFEETQKRARQFGHEQVDEFIVRCADEFALPENELRTEYAQIVVKRQQGVVTRCTR